MVVVVMGVTGCGKSTIGRLLARRLGVPFYDGDDPDVVPVYASSEVFQGYFAQAHAALAPLGAAHYLFMGDDVLLNPTVNAENLAERLGLGPETGFFPVLKSLCEADARWSPIFYPFKAFAPTPFVTVGDALPSRTEAEARFAAHGLAVQPLRWGQLLRLHRRKYQPACLLP